MSEVEQKQVPAGTPLRPSDLEAHYATVIKGLIDGRGIPFFGAGVNLYGRSSAVAWQPGQNLPSGSELSAYLVNAFDYKTIDTADLLRVSQYIEVMAGSGPLYEKLHELFATDYPSTPLHEFFATLPSVLRTKGYPLRYQLLVTTNYDDVLERAFTVAGQSFDVVTYMADGEHRGKFVHRSPNNKPRPINLPNKYGALPIDATSLIMSQPVILKIHGAVDRRDAEQDSYVITEDHYIDYLTRSDISILLPKTLVTKLKKSHFLFLGYSLRDWNLRVLLHRIWSTRQHSYNSWAIQLNPDELDRMFWKNRGVDVLNIRLEEYITTLRNRIQSLPRVPGAS